MIRVVPSFRLVALVAALSGFLAVTGSLLFAQGGESGGVAGIVKDSSGALVSGASVEVYNEQTKQHERHTVSTAAGDYSVGALRPGPYRVEVTAPGFRKYLVKVEVRLNEVQRQDVTLEVGSTAETVEVTAAGTLVNTETPTTGQPIDNQTLTTLPLAEPDYLFLLGLSPGTGAEPADVRKAARAGVDVSVNGQRTTNNSVTMEGIGINDFNLAHFDNLPIPNPEAIEEFKVATSLYDASLGSKGGGALALVLKSGSNGLHGGALWNVRNDAFNSNEWFTAHSNQRRGKLTQNVIDLHAGGPIPFLKGFWFFNVAGTRSRNGVDTSGASDRPTINAFPTNPDGTTSAALLASDPNVAGLVTAAQIDPVAVNILNLKSNFYGGTYLIPRPGQPGCDATPANGGLGESSNFNCQFTKVAKGSDTQYTGRYDRPLRHDKDKLSFTVFWDDASTIYGLRTTSDLASPRTDTIVNRFGTINYTTQISNRQLNEVKFGANRFVFGQHPVDLVTLAQVGATRANSAQFPGLYKFSTGTFSFGTDVNDDRGTASNMYQWGDNWSMTTGKHNFLAGGDWYRYQLNRFNNFGTRGSLTFTPIGTSQPTDWLNFITGTITGSQSGAGNPLRYFRAWSGDLYFQDNYRWSPRLTVNLGLRWEPMQFAHDKYSRNSNYNYKLAQQGMNPFLFPSALNQNGVTGTPGVSECTLKHCWDMNNFAPRIGFAWDISGNQKTVVRGGYGIYYQQISNQAELQGSLGAPFFISLITTRNNPAAQQLANPLPNQGAGGSAKALPQYVPTRSLFTGLAATAGCTGLTGQALLDCEVNDPGTLVNWTDTAGNLCGISGGTATDCGIDAASFTSADPNLHSPYTQQWNLTVQRDLGHSWALELGYVGSHGVGGIAIWVPFQARLASAASPIVVKDSSGNTYNITGSTLANESLREQALGLTFGTGASYTSNVGNQTYHSAQVTLSHRFQHGLFFQSGYTFAKNIDNGSGAIVSDELNGSPGRGGAAIYNDQSNPGANRALSDLDRRHRLTVSYAYELPIPKSGILGTQAFQGWGLNGLLTFQSGQVFSVADATAGGAYGFVLGTPLAICRAANRQVADAPGCTPGTPTNPLAALTSGSIQNRLAHYVNPNFFSHPIGVANNNDPGATGFGTLGMRNIYRGPFQQDVDFSVTKEFHITEKHHILFRTDFFNLFNHPVFSIPTCSTCLDLGASRANFGKITSTVIPARLIQFGLKYSF
jgi:carboxypeptidase family protein/TonB-dependent receptor-like protein